MTGVHASTASIEAVAAALTRCGQELDASARIAQVACAAEVGQFETALRDRQSAERQARLDRERTARLASGAHDADQAAAIAALAVSERQLASCVGDRERAERALDAARSAQAGLAGACRRASAAAAAALADGRSTRALVQPLSTYVRVPVSGGSGVSSHAKVTMLTSSIELVPLERIDDSDSRVDGPEDFNPDNFDARTAEWAAEEVDEVLVPAVRAGKDRAYFERRDRDEGRSADRSLARLYDTFIGERAVSLARKGDGSYEVSGGYHRIWAARQAGITSIPARVRR